MLAVGGCAATGVAPAAWAARPGGGRGGRGRRGASPWAAAAAAEEGGAREASGGDGEGAPSAPAAPRDVRVAPPGGAGGRGRSRQVRDAEALALGRSGVGRRGEQSGQPRRSPAPPKKAKKQDKYEGARAVWMGRDGEGGIVGFGNKAAQAMVGITIAAWIVIRFVGPAAGWWEVATEDVSLQKPFD